MSTFIKAEKVVATSLGLLVRELTLPRLVWRDAAFDFTGAKDDTISIRLPAYAPARTRALRSGASRTKDALHERKIDIELTTDVYKDIGITDEQLSLDIVNFGAQVLNPVVQGIGLQLEQEVADAITGATYENTIAHVSASDDAYETVVQARALLNDAHVPQAGRVLLVGSEFESELLTSDKFVHADKSGSTDTLREAIIGRVAGFTVVSGGGSIPPDEAYAFHQTAYALGQRAPVVPDGAPWGATQSYQGFAIRTVRVFDPDLVEDRFLADAWIGVTPVVDDGYFGSDGRFVPTTEPGETLGRSVTLSTSAAADDIIDATAHGFSAGDEVEFTALTGGTGLSTGTTYYVIASNLAANTFQVSATPGGTAVNFSADITAGTVAERARSLMIRSVKIAVS